MIALAVVTIAWYLLMAFAYALAPSFLDHFEPSIALGALRVLAGAFAGVTFCVLFTVACVRRHGPAVAVMQLALTVAGGCCLVTPATGIAQSLCN